MGRPAFSGRLCYGGSKHPLGTQHTVFLPCFLAKVAVMGNRSTWKGSIVWECSDHECVLCLFLKTSQEEVNTHATATINPKGVFTAILKTLFFLPI